jgi:hypothetical protein
MRCNVGRVDRTLRAVLAVGLLALAFFAALPPAWEIALFVLGAIAAFTALTGYCPLKEFFGSDSAEREPGPYGSP